MARDLRGHGLALHRDEDIWEMGRQDLSALSHLLGTNPYFFGFQPTTIDATVFGLFAAQGNPQSDAEIAENRRFRTRTSLSTDLRLDPGFGESGLGLATDDDRGIGDATRHPSNGGFGGGPPVLGQPVDLDDGRRDLFGGEKFFEILAVAAPGGGVDRDGRERRRLFGCLFFFSRGGRLVGATRSDAQRSF